MKLFLAPDELNSPASAGAKASNLNRMRHLGYRVPHFLVTPAALSENLFTSPHLRSALAKEVEIRLPRSIYCVRSNALIEDQALQSHAGKFKSVIGVKAKDLTHAILEVFQHAHIELAGDLSLFSIVIQEYIPAEISGVTFTRNPLGSREAVIEFSPETENRVVSGRSTPTRVELFHSNLSAASSKLPSPIRTALPGMARLESEYGFPQDIEWCVQGETLTYLQCRPISTLTPTQFESFRYLDRHPQLSGPHFFEKSEISEIAPRPKVFSFYLLSLLFNRDGPCHQVYRKYKIHVDPKQCLARFGNELYLDREAELRSFFPAKTFFKTRSSLRFLNRLLGLPRSLWNRWAYDSIAARCSVQEIVALESRLRILLTEPALSEDWETQLNRFLLDYVHFFEVNLLASAVTKRLEILLKGSPISPASALTEGVADLPRWRQEVISPVLEKTRHLNRLRDLSRIFFDSRMKALESALITHARELNLSPSESILFATPEEIRSRELLVSKLIERELEYESFSNWTLPSSLRDPKPRLLSWSLVTVSSGTSEGRLVSEAELLEILKSPQSSGTEDLILWTELLEPRLHHYFPHLQGILADRGGLLSHLAILARESRMPVWVNFRPSADFPLGSRIQVSNTGDVPVIRSASSRIRP